MASYSAPSEANIVAWTGIEAEALGLTGTQFTTRITALLTPAEAKVRLAVGATEFASADLSGDQVTLLQLDVARQVAALYAQSGAMQKVLGTHEPLLIEDADQVLDVADRFAAYGTADGAVVDAGTTDPGEQQIRTSLYERDDVAESDTDRVFRRNRDVYAW